MEVVAGSMKECFDACGPKGISCFHFFSQIFFFSRAKGNFHCKGVQLAPVFMPDTVAPEFKDVELLPWGLVKTNFFF